MFARKEAVKYALVQKVGISNAMLETYIPMLVQANLLDVSNNASHSFYKTTKKGKMFLKKFQELTELLRSMR
jgi:predicted transcriptional regulator